MKKSEYKNIGVNTHRLKSNPLEQKFVDEWEKVNTSHYGEIDGRGYLDYILANDKNNPNYDVTDRDREVAATVIQWLGSLVGQRFLDTVIDEGKE